MFEEEKKVGKRRERRREGGREEEKEGRLWMEFSTKSISWVFLGWEMGEGKSTKVLQTISRWKKKNNSQTSNKNKILDYRQYKIILHSFPIQKKKNASELLLEVIDSTCTRPLMTGGFCLPIPPTTPHVHLNLSLCKMFVLFLQLVTRVYKVGHAYIIIIIFNLNVWDLIYLLACPRGLG